MTCCPLHAVELRGQGTGIVCDRKNKTYSGKRWMDSNSKCHPGDLQTLERDSAGFYRQRRQRRSKKNLQMPHRY